VFVTQGAPDAALGPARRHLELDLEQSSGFTQGTAIVPLIPAKAWFWKTQQRSQPVSATTFTCFMMCGIARVRKLGWE